MTHDPIDPQGGSEAMTTGNDTRRKGMLLVPGMILTVEPMINEGSYKVVVDKGDGWTVRTKDGKLSAQFEHTIVVTRTGVEILTVSEAPVAGMFRAP